MVKVDRVYSVVDGNIAETNLGMVVVEDLMDAAFVLWLKDNDGKEAVEVGVWASRERGRKG